MQEKYYKTMKFIAGACFVVAGLKPAPTKHAPKKS
jgi:hypothetical protein